MKNFIGYGILIALLIVAGYFYNQEHKKRLEAEGTTQVLDTTLHGQITIANGQIENLQRENGKLKEQLKYVPPEGNVKILMEENSKLKAQIDQINGDKNQLTNKLADLKEKLKNAKTPEEVASLQKSIDAVQKQLTDKDDIIKQLEDQLQQMTAVYKTTGLTFRLGYGITYSDKFKPEIDCKLVYMGHFSGIIGLAFDTSDFNNSDLFAAITTHINLFTPTSFHFDNVELGIGPAYSFKQEKFKLIILLRANL